MRFDERIAVMGGEIGIYYSALSQYLLSFKNVKNRLSNRCDSYRLSGELICKIAIGGKTLKVYLAIDPKDGEIESKKIHFRDMSSSKAYEEVPAMIPVKSELCVRKVREVIDLMMSGKGATPLSSARCPRP